MLEMNAYLFLVSFIPFSSVTVMASAGVLQLLSQPAQAEVTSPACSPEGCNVQLSDPLPSAEP